MFAGSRVRGVSLAHVCCAMYGAWRSMYAMHARAREPCCYVPSATVGELFRIGLPASCSICSQSVRAWDGQAQKELPLHGDHSMAISSVMESEGLCMLQNHAVPYHASLCWMESEGLCMLQNRAVLYHLLNIVGFGTYIGILIRLCESEGIPSGANYCARPHLYS